MIFLMALQVAILCIQVKRPRFLIPPSYRAAFIRYFMEARGVYVYERRFEDEAKMSNISFLSSFQTKNWLEDYQGFSTGWDHNQAKLLFDKTPQEKLKMLKYFKRFEGLKKLECSICMNELLADNRGSSERKHEITDGLIAPIESSQHLELPPASQLRQNLLSPVRPTEDQQQELPEITKKCNNNDNHTLFKTPCGHRYHKECLLRWMEQSDCCPLCREPLPEYVSTHDFGF